MLRDGRPEGDLRTWYRQNRPAAAPEEPWGLLALTQKVIRQDFPRLLEEEEALFHFWAALDHVFRRFDPSLGDQDAPVQERFTLCFRVWLRQSLQREERRRRRQRRRWPILLRREILEEVPAPADKHDEPLEPFEAWSRRLYAIARASLDPRTRLALDLRQSGATVPQIAERLGLSESTVTNKYTVPRLAQAVQKAIRGLILDLAPAQQADLVAFLHNEGLSREKIGQLLCMPDWLLEQARGRGGPLPREHEVIAMLTPAWRAAA